MISPNIANMFWVIIVIIANIGEHCCNNIPGQNSFLTQNIYDRGNQQDYLSLTAQFFSTIMNKLDDMKEQLMQNTERQHETEQKLNQFFSSHYGINLWTGLPVKSSLTKRNHETPIMSPLLKRNAAPDWQSYKAMYRKFYINTLTESIHQQNFIQNVQKIKFHNARYEDGNVSYTLGINEFSDQDPKIFSSIMNGYKQPNETIITKEGNANETTTTAALPMSLLATNLDWRTQGKVSPVKHQGQCGACWAFSAVAAIESQMLMKGQNLVTLSEEQLVDCDKSNKGCGGGLFTDTWTYIKNAGGIQSDSDYPYTAGKDGVGSCKFKKSNVVTTVIGSVKVPNNNRQIMAKLRSIGPLSTYMYASDDLSQYKGGIYECSNIKTNHAVLIVGFGTERGQSYWIVKNSYGAGWGENGYVRVTRKGGSDCGLTQHVAYPII